MTREGILPEGRGYELTEGVLRQDLGKKARLYARHGVADYWVSDVTGSLLHRHSGPVEGVYQSIVQTRFDEAVAVPFDETVSVILADL